MARLCSAASGAGEPARARRVSDALGARLTSLPEGRSLLLEDWSSPEVRAWSDAQNVRTRPYLDALPGRPAIQYELTKLIKNDPRLSLIPVMIVSYKEHEQDRMRGLEAGADYYLPKGSFHDESLLEVVIDLIGEPES